jgi:hypothetical protein
MKIEDILSSEEIELVRQYAVDQAPYNEIRKHFPRFTRGETSFFSAYYADLKAKLKEVGSISLGAKDVPYYGTEDVDEIYPQYSWKDLPFNEKSWYRFREKNNYKK